jgi:coatomer subunit alpha
MNNAAVEILKTAGLTEADMDNVLTFSALSFLLSSPTPNINWPLASAENNFFDKALVNGHLEGNNRKKSAERSLQSG